MLPKIKKRASPPKHAYNVKNDTMTVTPLRRQPHLPWPVPSKCAREVENEDKETWLLVTREDYFIIKRKRW